MLRTGVIAIASLIIAAGCSSSSPENEQTESTESPSKSPEPKYVALTKAQAKASLLVLSDMPTGFSEDRSGDDDESEVTFKSGDAGCRDYVEGAYGGDKPTVDVSAFFMKDALGPYIKNGVTVREESDAKARMDKVISSLRTCKRFVDGSDNSKMSVSPVSFPKLGEQSVAVRLVIEDPDFQITGTFVSARMGGNTVSVGDAGVTGGVGADQLERLARMAVSRVESAAHK